MFRTRNHPRSKVLIAEDNVVNQRVATGLLAKRGHEVIVVQNGLEAVEASQRDTFDVAIMDVQMPEMGGLEATRLIRQLERDSGQHLRIVALTAHAMSGDRERFLAAGMDDYLAKPIDRLELYAAVEGTSSGVFPKVAPEESAAIDFRVIDELRDIDTNFVEDLIRKFSSEIEERIPEIQQACAEGDSVSLSRLGHLLRGSSVTMGARGMADICVALEQSASLEDFGRGAVLGRELEREFERVQRALRNRSHDS